MIESSIDNFHVEIKTEPQDHDFDQDSSSCIEYQNIVEPLQLKYEAEDEQIEEPEEKNPRACMTNPSRRITTVYKPPQDQEAVKVFCPAKKETDFEDDFEELTRSCQDFVKKHKEKLIISKCYKENFNNYEITGSKVELFNTLSSNWRVLNQDDEIGHHTQSNCSFFIVIPFGYPTIFFNSSNITAIEECLKETKKDFNLLKIELKNGMIKTIYKEFEKFLNIFDNVKDVKIVIDDVENQLWKIFKCDPHKKPFSIDNSTQLETTSFQKIKLSIKEFNSLKEIKEPTKVLPGTSTDIKIKDEPIDNIETTIRDIKIKQEIDEDQPMVSNLPLTLTADQQQYTYTIEELGNVKEEKDGDDFSYFTSQFPGTSGQSRNNADDDEDEFQYNTVNSFKSDLATRRSVSHTVVSGKSDKSKAEAALLAMKELMKIEQDKKVERERSAAGLNQVEKPKTMNVSLNVNGMRVVTKVSLPSVGAKKPVKSIEEECKYQCPICFIKFKTDGQLIGHKRIHDTAKAKLNTADMTKNVYKEVKMRIEQIGNRRSIHVLLPYYDYAFIVTNSTANKLYMKCFRQACEVKAYSTNDGKFFVKVGEEHCHGPDSEVILSKIDEKKRSDLEKTEVINKSVHDAIAQKQKQKNLMEEKKSALIERIKRSQEAVGGKNFVHAEKKRKYF